MCAAVTVAAAVAIAAPASPHRSVAHPARPARARSAPQTKADTLARVAARVDTSAHPDFSGLWKLSIGRSAFGKIPGGQPAGRTDSIRHVEPDVRQVLYLLNGTRRDTTVYTYRTDGSPTLSVVDGRDIHSHVEWEGRALHLASTTKLLMMNMSLDERWLLSPDSRTLTMRRHVKYALGEGDQTLVFERR
jgi:hypothetical protein